MTKQDIIDALTRDKKAPVVPLVVTCTSATLDMMDACGAEWPEAHFDSEKMALLGSMPYEMYGLKSVKVPFDVVVEAEALGAQVFFGSKDIVPQVKHNYLKSADDLVMPADLSKAGRIPVVLDAIRILKKKYNDVPIICNIMGPTSVASMLYGFETLLLWMATEDDSFNQVMQFLTDFIIAYSKLVEEAGADVIQYGEAAASGGILGKDRYEENITQFHRQFADQLSVPVVMHICGDITSYLPILNSCNIDSINFDQKTNMKTAKEILGGCVKATGNIDPVSVLLQGTPEDVEKAVFQCLDDGADVLCPGCSLAPRTSHENMKALVAAYEKYMSAKPGAK